MTAPEEFKLDEQRHVDLLARANRQLLERINELKAAGEDLSDLFVGTEIGLKEASILANWRKACRK